MKFLILAAVMVGAAGCLIPVSLVPIDERDGGSGGGSGGGPTGGGATGGGDTGGCNLPDELEPATAGQPTTLPTATCGSTTVTAPNGEMTIGSSITPTEPGEYVVSVQTPGGTVTRYLLVDGEIDATAGFTRTYVDRIDGCVRTLLTDEGRLVCESGFQEISVYEADGGLHTRFAGGSVSVDGNEVWSSVYGAVEHRTDTPSALRFDGAFADPLIKPLLSTQSVYPHGDSSPGRSVRGSPEGLVEVMWDGTTLAAGARFDLLLWSDGSNAIVENGIAITSNYQRIRAGCSTMTCPSVQTPIQMSDQYLRIVALAEDRFWTTEFSSADSFASIQLRARPLTDGHELLPKRRLSPDFGTRKSSLASSSRPLFWDDRNNRYHEPVAGTHGIFFRYMTDALALQPRQTILLVDPFTIRIIPN